MLTREEGLARSGENNAKEAHALQLLRALIKEDGRVCLAKSFETAMADFCVYLPGRSDEAIGVQLKTSFINDPKRTFFQFSHTLGYTGLLMMLVGFRGADVRAWLMPGATVTCDHLRPPVLVKGRLKTPWSEYETPLATVPFLDLLSRPSPYDVKPAIEWHKPTEPSRVVEYNAFQLLKSQIPLDFIEPDVEHRPYDWLVDGLRWQLKVATYIDKADMFQVILSKSGGTKNGRQSKIQYGDNDFDFLCVQLPQSKMTLNSLTPKAYIVPMPVLVQLGVVGKTVSAGSLRIYPHRQAHVTTNWSNAFAVDLTTPSSALSDYHRILSGVDLVRTPISRKYPTRNADLPPHIYRERDAFRLRMPGRPGRTFHTLEEAIEQRRLNVEEDEVKSVLDDVIADVELEF